MRPQGSSCPAPHHAVSLRPPLRCAQIRCARLPAQPPRRHPPPTLSPCRSAQPLGALAPALPRSCMLCPGAALQHHSGNAPVKPASCAAHMTPRPGPLIRRQAHSPPTRGRPAQQVELAQHSTAAQLRAPLYSARHTAARVKPLPRFWSPPPLPTRTLIRAYNTLRWADALARTSSALRHAFQRARHAWRAWAPGPFFSRRDQPACLPPSPQNPLLHDSVLRAWPPRSSPGDVHSPLPKPCIIHVAPPCGSTIGAPDRHARPLRRAPKTHPTRRQARSRARPRTLSRGACVGLARPAWPPSYVVRYY